MEIVDKRVCETSIDANFCVAAMQQESEKVPALSHPDAAACDNRSEVQDQIAGLETELRPAQLCPIDGGNWKLGELDEESFDLSRVIGEALPSLLAPRDQHMFRPRRQIERRSFRWIDRDEAATGVQFGSNAVAGVPKKAHRRLTSSANRP
ncbi:hypothetical protein NLM33_38510 [Bradyrhizobium sp. CCGUVB1N3]|uniref:hypothetical protein n=1 Tax=Bradyrhizobium sp. CCGUVB1N3 TaxID=2949629 RepID=UPI0020B441EB|nr:hypothetical protein [Bradyrhizobium sp. CCGUVB1N3]MCP3476124.1 hypothetical protein [Bradyrhizobium sp. CCGUVB1N3]